MLLVSTFSPNCSRKTRRLREGRKPRCFGCMKTTYPKYWIVLMSQGNTSLTLNRIFQDFFVVLRILKVLINLQKDSFASCSSVRLKERRKEGSKQRLFTWLKVQRSYRRPLVVGRKLWGVFSRP